MARYAVVVAAVAAVIVTAAAGVFIIPFLRKLKFGQTINEIGPKWHKSKQGTPTMGGFLFIFGSCAGLLLASPMLGSLTETADPRGFQLLLLGVLTALAFAAVGFLDDYLKVVRKKNLGLRAREKLLLQGIIAIAFLVSLHLLGRLSPIVRLPFFGAVNLGLFFYPLALFLILATVNAVNLTDGIDGLATAVTLWVMCGYFVLLTMAEKFPLSIWAAALAGGCVGFLFWNFYPAKVFMGDTGSMFLGGAVVALGFCMGRPDIMLGLGLVYLLEELSVVIQVCYFKLTKGKRIFKMTPIHHHFELSGWSEVRIVAVFSFAGLVCAVLTYIYAFVLG